MTITAFILFQSVLLTLIAIIGVAFTLALPTPSHKHKAQASTFSRWFLICMSAGQICLVTRHVGYEVIYVTGFNLFSLVSAYLLYIAVIKRFGHGLKPRFKLVMLAHIALLEVLSLYFYLGVNNEAIRDVLLLLSCVFPISLAVRHIGMMQQTAGGGEKTLISVLVVSLFIIAVFAPVYLIFLAGSEFEQTVMSLLMNILLQMLFITGFAVSLVRSLVNRLNEKVYTDALTRAHNRHFFYTEAPKLGKEAHDKQQTFCAITLDIDHFKAINDSYGHVVGDKVLKHLTLLLKAELRKEDALIRMGGEEFLILLSDSTLASAEPLAERLRQCVEASPFVIEQHQITLSASFGVVEIPPGQDMFKAIESADNALYKAKASGRNRVVAVSE